MTDTSEDYRVKNAREGKVIKTVAEVVEQMAKADAHKAQLETRELALSIAQWSELDTAIPDIILIVSDVRNVFFDMAYQEDLDKPGINSMMRLAARA